MENELNKIANQFFFQSDFRPNPEPVFEVIDKDALFSEFLIRYQQSGGDIARFNEEEWRDMLEERFRIGEDEMGDYMEILAQWGVVDNLEQ